MIPRVYILKKYKYKYQNNTYNFDRGSNIAEIFKKLVFFSVKRTQSLQNKLGPFGLKFNLTELYQFEARYFQYSLIKNNILFIRQYGTIENNNINGDDFNCNHKQKNHNLNVNKSTNKYCTYANTNIISKVNHNCKTTCKQLMIFKFGCACPNGGGRTSLQLFGVCEENNRFPDQQPWHCKHVLYKHELFDFLSSLVSGGWGKDQQRYLDHQLAQDCVSSRWGADECEEDSSSNSSINIVINVNVNRNLGGPNVKVASGSVNVGSGCNQSVVSFGNGGIKHQHAKKCELQFIEKEILKLESKIGIIYKTFDIRLGYQSNSNAIVRKLGQGLGRIGKNGDNIHYDSKPTKHMMEKRNSLNKFEYVKYLCWYLSVDKRTLLNKLVLAIENAFIFSKKFPSTVLTQAYVDENKCKVIYELVLLAELQCKSKFFKFGVPVSVIDQSNKNSHKKNNWARNKNSKRVCFNNCTNINKRGKIYFSQNILTPYMVRNNVRLNCNGYLPENSWICDKYVYNDYLSVYNQFDPSIHRSSNSICYLNHQLRG